MATSLSGTCRAIIRVIEGGVARSAAPVISNVGTFNVSSFVGVTTLANCCRAPPPGLGLVVEFHPFLDASRVGGAVRGPEFPIPARQAFSLLRSDPGGRVSDVTVPGSKIVTRYRQAQQPFRVRERIIRGNATAGGRGHGMKLLHSQEFDQIMQVFRTDPRVVLGRQFGVVIIPARIGDDAVAGFGEYGLLV